MGDQEMRMKKTRAKTGERSLGVAVVLAWAVGTSRCRSLGSRGVLVVPSAAHSRRGSWRLAAPRALGDWPGCRLARRAGLRGIGMKRRGKCLAQGRGSSADRNFDCLLAWYQRPARRTAQPLLKGRRCLAVRADGSFVQHGTGRHDTACCDSGTGVNWESQDRRGGTERSGWWRWVEQMVGAGLAP